jgi:hypothetical protein
LHISAPVKLCRKSEHAILCSVQYIEPDILHFLQPSSLQRLELPLLYAMGEPGKPAGAGWERGAEISSCVFGSVDFFQLLGAELW